MFIIFINQIQCRELTHRYLSYEEAHLTTSYFTPTFHPTIVQCAPKYLSNTDTPELGMILTRDKEH